MAKIPRVLQKQFGSTGLVTYFGQFGSKQAGFPITSKDAATIQALAAFTQNGWPDAINSSNKAPFLEEMNALHFLIFQQLCNIFQDGVPVWEPNTTYFTGCVVRKDGTSELYSSAIDNNTGNALPSQANNSSWNYMNTTNQIPPGTIADFGGSSAPAGWLLCDGSSYATATYPGLFAAISYAWGGSGANFNVPDLRGRATIGAGTGSGLSARTLAQIIGEESHVLVTGEMPSHAHSVNDPGHQHSQQFMQSGSGAVANFLSGVVGSRIGTSFVDTAEKTLLANTGITLSNTGGGAGHNNMQPSAVVNKIIKF